MAQRKYKKVSNISKNLFLKYVEEEGYSVKKVNFYKNNL